MHKAIAFDVDAATLASLNEALPGWQINEVRGATVHSCLMLPIHAQDVASMLLHARAGNQPGRHTLNLEGAQTEDRWRDVGGQG